MSSPSCDAAGADRHEQVIAARRKRGKHGPARFDAYQCLGDRGVVDLAAGRIAPHKRDVHPECQPGTADHMFDGVRRGGGDVRAVERLGIAGNGPDFALQYG